MIDLGRHAERLIWRGVMIFCIGLSALSLVACAWQLIKADEADAKEEELRKIRAMSGDRATSTSTDTR